MQNFINHYQTPKGGSFYYELAGRQLAEMVYVMNGEKLMIIDHTEVDESLKGQGIGKQLLNMLVLYARDNHIKVIPLCPFANAMFKKMPEWQDVLNNAGLKLKG